MVIRRKGLGTRPKGAGAKEVVAVPGTRQVVVAGTAARLIFGSTLQEKGDKYHKWTDVALKLSINTDFWLYTTGIFFTLLLAYMLYCALVHIRWPLLSAYIVICSECKLQHILLALPVMDIVYRTRRTMEREEMEAAQGLQELGEGIVYTEVRGLPAPTAHPRAAAQPVMDQLPRRIDGMHPRVAREEAMMQGWFTGHSLHIAPTQVPERLVPTYHAAGSLCLLKKGIEFCKKKINKLSCKNNQDVVLRITRE